MFDVFVPIFVFITIVLICLGVWRLNHIDKKKTLITTNAIVKKKRIDEWKNSANSPLIKEFYVVFEIEGHDIELKVPKFNDYEKLQTGDIGVLTYQKKIINNIFNGFIRQ